MQIRLFSLLYVQHYNLVSIHIKTQKHKFVYRMYIFRTWFPFHHSPYCDMGNNAHQRPIKNQIRIAPEVGIFLLSFSVCYRLCCTMVNNISTIVLKLPGRWVCHIRYVLYGLGKKVVQTVHSHAKMNCQNNTIIGTSNS